VLGKTGRNFAAGMSGGIAYVYDEDGEFASRCNTSMVSLERVGTAAEQKSTAKTRLHKDQADEPLLKKLLEEHNRWTGSKRARELLDTWAIARTKFVKVFPNEYKRALAEMYEREVEAASAGSNAQVAMKHPVAAA
jgi:glutamate synthase (NADPH) large chain